MSKLYLLPVKDEVSFIMHFYCHREMSRLFYSAWFLIAGWHGLITAHFKRSDNISLSRIGHGNDELLYKALAIILIYCIHCSECSELIIAHSGQLKQLTRSCRQKWNREIYEGGMLIRT